MNRVCIFYQFPKHREMQAWFNKSWPQVETSLFVLELEMLVPCVLFCIQQVSACEIRFLLRECSLAIFLQSTIHVKTLSKVL